MNQLGGENVRLLWLPYLGCPQWSVCRNLSSSEDGLAWLGDLLIAFGQNTTMS